MWLFFIIIGICICGYEVIQTKNLTHSALWLALTSALVSWLVYLLGAQKIAVIELSVGAGVVTILLVFAINIVGNEQETKKSFIPTSLILFIVVSAIIMIGSLFLPMDNPLNQRANDPGAFSLALWEHRFLDTMLQIILIFTCVLGVLSLMEKREHLENPEFLLKEDLNDRIDE
jgi:NADH:ubiquinone oxidoreductase subunit 6 (subunit J)